MLRTKVAPIIIALTLLPCSVLASFSDVSDRHSYNDDILFMWRRGYVSGYPDGTYQPEKTINRAEFTKIIIASLYKESEIDSCLTAPFADTKRGAWFTPFVCIAHREGIIEGYPSGEFKPSLRVNMAEPAGGYHRSCCAGA